jgi:hypothetical protein
MGEQARDLIFSAALHDGRAMPAMCSTNRKPTARPISAAATEEPFRVSMIIRERGLVPYKMLIDPRARFGTFRSSIGSPSQPNKGREPC